jgi:adenosylhomocysteine nucleosidase
LILVTGMGADKTSAALNWVFRFQPSADEAFRPQVVIAAGFAGGLKPELKIGDIVWATEVVDLAGGRWRTSWPPEPATHFHCGRLLTVDTLIADSARKFALGSAHSALAVDMESAVVARLCTEAGMPFACVRAISDDSATSLSPRLATLLSAGRISTRRVLASLATTPSMVKEFLILARHTRIAARKLSEALISAALTSGQESRPF